MALIPKTGVCSTCTALTFTDETGSYNVSTNAGGWGVPNLVRADCQLIELDVYPPGAVQPTTFDLLTDAPTPDTNGFYSYEYTAADFGTSTLRSGVWNFIVRITDVDGNGLEPVRLRQLLIGEIGNSVKQELLAVDETRLSDFKDQLAAFLVLTGAKLNGRCGKSGRAQDQVDWLYLNVKSCKCA